MNDIQISNVSQFLEETRKLFSLTLPYSYNLWFRAESSAFNSTHLIPNAYREYFIPPITIDRYASRESNRVTTFMHEAYPHLVKHNLTNSLKGAYFLMQHYGAPTRLLDWTENSLVSLFFAVENEISTDDSIVWCLNAYRLNACLDDNKMQKEMMHPSLEDSKTINKYLDSYNLENMSEDTKHPIAIKPFYIDERMKNQSACFTLFGHQKNGLLQHPKKHLFLHKILVPSRSFRTIKKELYQIGISYDTIYPGLEGISKRITYASSIASI